MDEDDRKFLRELKAQKEIHECLVRYCRGLDRGDRELMMSAYHPDGFDEHGVFNGPAPDMVEWAISSHLTQFEYHHHHLSNVYIEVDGENASAESAVSCVLRFRRDGKLHDYTVTGRYLDRFECRNGQWKIAHRLAIGECGRVDPVLDLEDITDLIADRDTMTAPPVGYKSPQDPSYTYFRRWGDDQK